MHRFLWARIWVCLLHLPAHHRFPLLPLLIFFRFQLPSPRINFPPSGFDHYSQYDPTHSPSSLLKTLRSRHRLLRFLFLLEWLLLLLLLLLLQLVLLSLSFSRILSSIPLRRPQPLFTFHRNRQRDHKVVWESHNRM